jgi:photosystem II stability/assembly factor-like uncharacterized protein
MVSVTRLSLLGLMAAVGLCPAAVFHGVAVAPNSNHAWVATSDDAFLHHTSNLGNTWELQHADQYRVFYDVFFLDSLTGWTCGFAATIWHTTSGGDSWYRQNLAGPHYLYRIRFFDDSVGCSAGSETFFLYATNRGEQWHSRMLPYPPFVQDSVDFQGLDFQTRDTVWMVSGKPVEDDTEYVGGQGFIVKLSSNADTWKVSHRDTVWDFYDVACIDARNICVVGGNDRTGRGVVLRTSDAGATWCPATILPSACYLRSMKFVGETYGWACGDSGTIIMTANSGLTWYRQPTPTCSTLYDIDFADRERGMASGAGVVLTTTNGGLTWLNATPIGIAEPKPPTTPPLVSLRVLASPSRPPIRFAVSGARTETHLAIYDASGRLIRSFSPLLSPPSSLAWNGLDLRGVPVPSGTYFARLGRSSAEACTFTLLARNRP